MTCHTFVSKGVISRFSLGVDFFEEMVVDIKKNAHVCYLEEPVVIKH